MAKFYSKSTNGFYDDGIHGAPSHPQTKIPADAVAITDETWRSLLDGQGKGKIIAADSNGHPQLVERS